MLKVSRNLFTALVILAIAAAALYYHRRFGGGGAAAEEGFTQISQFVLNSEDKAYDDFYADAYDELFGSEKQTKYIVNSVLDATSAAPPPPRRSDVSGGGGGAAPAILDIGCGTGRILAEFARRGYNNIYGLDKSESMVTVARDAAPAAAITIGNALDSMIYDRGVFTHILCVNMVIYEIATEEEKSRVFTNAYTWLEPGGHFILHAVSRKKKMAAAVAAAPPERNFRGVVYRQNYSVNKEDDSQLILSEYFMDEKTKHIRQNERTLYLMEMSKMVDLVISAGFKQKTVIDMSSIKQPDEYLIVFVRGGGGAAAAL